MRTTSSRFSTSVLLRNATYSAACLFAALAAVPAAAEEPVPVSYARDIRPIFQARCVGCHQPAKPEGGYSMNSFAALLVAGDSDEPAIVPGKPEESFLVDLITPDDGEADMPAEGEPLAEEELETISRWIAEGARDDSPAEGPPVDADHPPIYTQPPVITSLDYSPDGALIAIAGEHEVRLHNADGSKLVGRLIGLAERIEAVRFSPDGKWLAVAGGNPALQGELQVWDVEEQELVLSVMVGFDTLRGVSWSPDGKQIAFGCSSDNTVRAIDSETGEQLLYQSASNDWPLDTVYSIDGSHLVSVGRDTTAKLIEVATQRFVDNITSITPGALKGGIHSVARHPLRDEILYGGSDGVPRIYRMHRQTKRVIGDDANLLFELPALEGRLFCVEFSADGTLIAAGSSLNGRGAIHVYRMSAEPKTPDDIQNLLVKPTHTRSKDEVEKLAKHFADAVETIAEIQLDNTAIYAVSISPDGQTVAATGSDGIVRLVNAESGEVASEFPVVEFGDENKDIAAGATVIQADVPPDAQDASKPIDEVPMPTGIAVERLVVEPAELLLEGVSDYAQLVVTAEVDDGRAFDVTRQAEITLDQEVATVGPNGLLMATTTGSATLTVKLGKATTTMPLIISGNTGGQSVDYIQDVSPIIARAGCNAGTCHGAQDGKNGFKLSLRGYDPLFDVRALTDDHASRRVNLASPERSLMLLKSTAQVPHEGGQAIKPGGRYYKQLIAWIQEGARLDADSPRVAKLTVVPINPVVETIGQLQQVRVVAHFADGRSRDVTSEAFIESGNTDAVETVAAHPGLMRAVRRGESAVLVRYEGAYAATTLTVMGDREGFAWVEPPANNRIDALVAEKLQRTKTSPAPMCNDYEFVRRVHLDLTGLPPTPDVIRSFVADERDSRAKRDELIDRLIGSDDYIEHWANKWADLLQVNGKFLGREGATSFRNWIRAEVAGNTRYDQFAVKLLTASGSNRENPAASYFKTLRTPEDTMENTTHLFLGTRFNCNKCHDHPFERWTQDQYYELAAYFAKVKLDRDPESGDRNIGGTAVESGKPLYEIVTDGGTDEMLHDRTGAVTLPHFPFDCDHEVADGATRREQLAQWIISPANPYFARSYVNRLWGYLLGTGIIEPIDDIRAGNPPSNPELLAYLTAEFIEHDFDTRHVIRLICQSRTYQLSVATDKWNADDRLNFSHAKARRLPAEVLYDTVYQATGATAAFPGVPAGTRAAALPDAGIKLPDGFLDSLGRPARESACECERVNEMQLGPVMALVSGPTVGNAISDTKNEIAKLAASDLSDAALIEEIYLRVLNRPPSKDEVAGAESFLRQIQSDHDLLVESRDTYAKELAPRLAERELKRQQTVIRLEAALTAHRMAIAPHQKKLQAEREKQIAKREAEFKTYEENLAAGLAEWEEQLRESLGGWITLAPSELETTIPGELVQESDGSIFADVQPGMGEYRIVSYFNGGVIGTKITAVRIEALTDDRLPSRGPGRGPSNGNFVLTELYAAILPGEGEEKVDLKFAAARADFSQPGYDVATAIDGETPDASNGWAVASQTGKPHVAVFEFAEPVELGEGGRLELRLVHLFSDSQHVLGRFRISTSSAELPVGFGLQSDIETILAIEASERTTEQTASLIAYRKKNDKQFKVLQQAIAEAKKPAPKDAKLAELEGQLAAVTKPLPVDSRLRQFEQDIALSGAQLENVRLTAAQDLTWALINSPAFLYNH